MSSIEMSVSNLEKEVSTLDSKTKTVSQSVDDLNESLGFFKDEIAAMKLKADDIKGECCSNTYDLRKRIIYLKHIHSRRKNLKFLDIPEDTNFNNVK